jgi:hypothetical protein
MLAGSKGKNGYFYIGVLGKKFLSHRLAYLMHYGEMPSCPVDHINGIPTDNRIVNLRAVSQSANMQNMRRATSASSTGLLGVATTRRSNFVAQIRAGGKRIHIGTFDTAEQAHAAYIAVKRRLHEGCTI